MIDHCRCFCSFRLAHVDGQLYTYISKEDPVFWRMRLDGRCVVRVDHLCYLPAEDIVQRLEDRDATSM